MPTSRKETAWLLLVALCCWLPKSALAVQLQQTSNPRVALRFIENPATDKDLVIFGDVIEVTSGLSPMLASLLKKPLGPAPREGDKQTWHQMEILQHLEARGLRRTNIRWSGPTLVTLRRVASHPQDRQTAFLAPAFVNEQTVNQANRNVEQAIKEYLNLRTGERTDWRIGVEIPANQTEFFRSRRMIKSIGGGKEPWEGTQAFTLEVSHKNKLIRIPIKATIALPDLVLTAKTSIRREQLVRFDQLTLTPLPRGAEVKDYYTDPEELVGKQARRTISSSLAIKRSDVGSPILITRNDLIELESVVGAVTVSTGGRALESGSKGELIQVEVGKRKRLYAIVMDSGRARVSSGSAPSSR